jgi:hypothetical protein
MATMQDILTNPIFHMGLGLMSAGAPRIGQPANVGAELQRSMGTLAQMQEAAQMQQMRNVQLEQTRMQQQQAEADRARQRAVMTWLQQNPQAAPGDITRHLLQMTGDPSLLRYMQDKEPTPPYTVQIAVGGDRVQTMQWNPESRKHDIPLGSAQPRWRPQQAPREKLPAPREIVDVPLPDGRVQKMRFNPQTRDYDIPIGAPYQRTTDVLSQLLGGQLPGAITSPAPAQPAAAPASPQPKRVPRPLAAERLKGGPKPPTPPRISTQAEYDALPSGALYVEDGVTYRKP